VDGTSNPRMSDPRAPKSRQKWAVLTRIRPGTGPLLPDRNTNTRTVILAFLSIGNRDSTAEEEAPTVAV
jgi:hypothetical protein